MTAASERSSPAESPWPHLLAVGLLTLVLYLPTLGADFVRWDDNINVYDNEHVQGLTWDHLKWMFADLSHALRYKPLSWLTWCLIHEVCGLEPGGYHLVNILIHAVNATLACLLFAWLLQSSTDSPDRRPWLCAAIGALIWSLHPLRVEPVAWVTGLPYDLSVMFALLAGVLYWRFATSPVGTTRRGILYGASLVAYFLALLTYPIVLGLCLLPAVMDWWRARQTGTSTPLLRGRHTPFLAAAAIMVALNVLGRMSENPLYVKAATIEEFSVTHRAMQGFYVWSIFLLKHFWTAGLAPAYSDLFGFQPFAWRFLASAGLVIGVSGLLFRLRREYPVPGVLWLCHLAWLVPVLGLTENQHTPYDRYTYASGLLIGFLAATALWQAAAWPGRRIAFAAACAGLMLFALQSFLLIGAWKNSETLFLHTIAQTRSPSLRADFWKRLGHWYLLRQEFAAAEIAYTNALPESPGDGDLHYRIAFTQFRQRKVAQALPHYEVAHRSGVLKGDFLSDYAVALVATGQLEAAAQRFAEVVAQEPDNPAFHRNLALTLRRLGRDGEAARHERRAAELVSP